jgi:hypothetical protein
MPKISSLKRLSVNSSRSTGNTNSASPRNQRTSRSHTSYLFNCIMEGRVHRDIHVYKKCERYDIDAESVNNKEQFATQFYNLMRKYLDIIISQVSVPQINLDIGIAPPEAVPTPLPVTKSTLWMTTMNSHLAHYSMSKAGH